MHVLEMLLHIPNTVAMISPMTNGTAAANTASSTPAFFCDMKRDQNLARTIKTVNAPRIPQSINRPGPRVVMPSSIGGGGSGTKAILTPKNERYCKKKLGKAGTHAQSSS